MKRLVLGGALIAQWFGTAVIAYVAGRPNIRWNLVAYEFLVAILAGAVIALVFYVVRWRRMNGGFWLSALVLAGVSSYYPLTEVIRPGAALNERFALLVCLTLVMCAPLAVAAYYEQKRENRID
jgi:hypothetical protein